MQKRFNVYTKRGGLIAIEGERFDHIDNTFTFYNRYDAPLTDYYLRSSNVAAIVPDKQERTDGRYKVFLRNSDSFDVRADSFRINTNAVQFFSRRYSEDVEIKDVFVSIDQVTAIVPST